MANKANLANSVLFAPLSDSATSLTVYTGDGSLFPSVPFYVTLSPKNKWSRKINSEIVLVTARSGDTLTITRAQKGTTAKAFEYGDLVANGIYAEDLTLHVLEAMMPVGFVVTLGVSTNPNTLYGFGTWTQITGKVIVGLDSGQTEFDALNETGGAKTVTLTSNEMPSHNHGITEEFGATANGGLPPSGSIAQIGNPGAGTRQIRNDVITNTGGGAAHNNLQPYIVKYIWERTA
jgi:hypothetical protein